MSLYNDRTYHNRQRDRFAALDQPYRPWRRYALVGGVVVALALLTLVVRAR